MNWLELYPAEKKPTMGEISIFIGGKMQAEWDNLMTYFESAYKAKPKLTFSSCSGKPGWNVKFQKSGQSFGTLYPEENAFSVFIVISYKIVPLMEKCIPSLSPDIAEIYKNAGDYMKLGKWMMFQIKDAEGVEDYKKMISIKLEPKYA